MSPFLSLNGPADGPERCTLLGTGELDQLQVVVALLAFGLLAGASGSAAAAVVIDGQVQASGSPLANSTVTFWQASGRA